MNKYVIAKYKEHLASKQSDWAQCQFVMDWNKDATDPETKKKVDVAKFNADENLKMIKWLEKRIKELSKK